jgi:hypothetical protein
MRQCKAQAAGNGAPLARLISVMIAACCIIVPRPTMLKPTLILIFLFLFTSGLHANVTITYSVQNSAYFTLEIPDSWRVNVGSETDAEQVPAGELAPPRVITLMPDDGSILWFATWVPVYLHTLDAAQEYLSSLDDFLVDNAVLVKTDEVDLNNMPARYFRGKGETQGEPVDYFVMLFELSEENIGIAIYIGSEDTTKAHLQDLRDTMRSITPIRE